ncbi:MAG: hypothetical protein MjAS7_1771 [Metallosphaera javensis (ex Sakai et al. 2022)]|nr:MAG: hypothetical protein MjAS7_1771 [Metallosphaera javensis (ex Sakai et al. 2022)]
MYSVTGTTVKMIDIAMDTRLWEKDTRNVVVEIEAKISNQKYNPPLRYALSKDTLRITVIPTT